MAIIAGYDSVSRERAYTSDFNEQKQFALEAFKTPIGERFLSNFENSPENIQVILGAATTLFPGEVIIVSRFVSAMDAAMRRAPSLERWAPGKLKRNPAVPVVPAAPEPEVPKDRHGKPLTPAQILWGQYQRFLNEASSAQIAERRRNDAGFRAFIQHNLRDQMDQEIDGDMRPTNPHLTPKAPTQAAMADSAMVEFANRYRTMGAADLRKAKRYDTNPLGAKKFNEDEARAIELHLI